MKPAPVLVQMIVVAMTLAPIVATLVIFLSTSGLPQP